MIPGSHFGKYCSRLSISKYMGSQAARKTLYPDLHKCKVSHQAPKRSNLVLKNGLKIRICTSFKTQNLSQFPTAPLNRAPLVYHLPLCKENFALPPLPSVKKPAKEKQIAKVTIYTGHIGMTDTVFHMLSHNQGVWGTNFFSPSLEITFQRIGICLTEILSEPEPHVLIWSLPPLPQ